jgi:hypothetical protein
MAARDVAVVSGARRFAVGGMGLGGMKTEEENALVRVCMGPWAEETLERIVGSTSADEENSTTAGRLYALVGLRCVSSAEKFSTLREEFEKEHGDEAVDMKQGCIGGRRDGRYCLAMVEKYALELPQTPPTKSAAKTE